MTYHAEYPHTTLSEHWHATAAYLSAALREIATELGGEDYAAIILTLSAQGEDILPNSTALAQLEQNFPSAAAAVFDRAEALQRAAHQQELDEVQRTRVRRVASAIATSLGRLR